MLRRRGTRFIASLALALALAGPAAAHAAGGPAILERLAAGIHQWLWSALPWSGTAEADCDAGSSIDPNGGCRAGQASSVPDKGASIDPNGEPASEPDKGLSIDPDG